MVHDCMKTKYEILRPSYELPLNEVNLRSREEKTYCHAHKVGTADSQVSTCCDFVSGWNLCPKDVNREGYEEQRSDQVRIDIHY